MTDKEMIEEMYNLFLNYKYGKVDWKKFDCITKDFFEFLYNAGYRKIPEGSVVLSKEEYAKDFCSQFNKGYERGSKETARAFWYMAVTQINDIVNVSPDNEKGLFEAGVKLARGRVLRVLNEVLKQFGVEVEE